jgi:hypothetical protein
MHHLVTTTGENLARETDRVYGKGLLRNSAVCPVLPILSSPGWMVGHRSTRREQACCLAVPSWKSMRDRSMILPVLASPVVWSREESA